MVFQTNLRMLRHRHHVSLTELAVCANLSKQYFSRAELGEIAATARLEKQTADALETVISKRKAALLALEADYITYKGNLLNKGEHPNEQ